MEKAAKEGVQLEFPCLNHGGFRTGSGRKAKRHADGSRVHVSHGCRARFAKSRPLHVTIELEPGLPSLRGPLLAAVACDAIERSNRREDFRIVHVCLLSNHLHLICEAEGREALSLGVQGLNVRLAKAVNRQLERSGRVIHERYHVHVLETVAEVRNAVQYVLRNAERHGLVEGWPNGMGGTGMAPRPDPHSWGPPEVPLRHAGPPSSVPPPVSFDDETRPAIRPVRGRDEGERDRILWALERCAGNQTKAARLLGVSRRTLVARLEEYNLPRPRKNAP